MGDLSRVIETVAPDQKVVLAGSSRGVKLAVLFIHFHPSKVCGLILSGLVPAGVRASRRSLVVIMTK